MSNKQVFIRHVMVPVKVVVDFKDGFFYATVPTLRGDNHTRPNITTVRSTDREAAVSEALLAAGYGSGRDP